MQVIRVYLQSNRKYNFELYQTDYTVKSIHRVQTLTTRGWYSSFMLPEHWSPVIFMPRQSEAKTSGVPVLRFAAVSLLLHITQSNSIFLWFSVFCLWGVTHLKHRPCWDFLHSDIPSSITFSGTLTRLPPILYGYVCLGGRTLWFCLRGYLKT